GMVAGLHAGLKAVLAEGIPAAAKRHREAGEHFQARAQERGWELFAAEGHRLPMLTSVVVPEGVDSVKVRGWLLENKDIEIGAGTARYASRIWRIGLTGPNATIETADSLSDAIVEAVEPVSTSAAATAPTRPTAEEDDWGRQTGAIPVSPPRWRV